MPFIKIERYEKLSNMDKIYYHKICSISSDSREDMCQLNGNKLETIFLQFVQTFIASFLYHKIF